LVADAFHFIDTVRLGERPLGGVVADERGHACPRFGREGAHGCDRRRVFANKRAGDVEREIAAVARDDGSGEVNAVADAERRRIIRGEDAQSGLLCRCSGLDSVRADLAGNLIDTR